MDAVLCLLQLFALCRFAFCDLSLVKKILSFALLVVSLGWRKIFVLGVHLFDLVLLLSIVKKSSFLFAFFKMELHTFRLDFLQLSDTDRLYDFNCPCTPTRIFHLDQILV